ncbi:hypothetical protein EDB80DRAFT_691322 [Ilyonectria destructans]|nr:hypothetical protein EDB80DRAFT_691322 [Ilyonectria destructans]
MRSYCYHYPLVQMMKSHLDVPRLILRFLLPSKTLKFTRSSRKIHSPVQSQQPSPPIQRELHSPAHQNELDPGLDYAQVWPLILKNNTWVDKVRKNGIEIALVTHPGPFTGDLYVALFPISDISEKTMQENIEKLIYPKEFLELFPKFLTSPSRFALEIEMRDLNVQVGKGPVMRNLTVNIGGVLEPTNIIAVPNISLLVGADQQSGKGQSRVVYHDSTKPDFIVDGIDLGEVGGAKLIGKTLRFTSLYNFFITAREAIKGPIGLPNLLKPL